MVRSGIAAVVLGLVVLFGYFVATDSSRNSGADKARSAAGRVGDTVVDQGIAGLVHVRLATTFGLDAARFLHVHHDDGKVLIYGLLAENLSVRALRLEAAEIPGVKEVEVLVVARPTYLTAPPPADSTSAEAATDGARLP